MGKRIVSAVRLSDIFAERFRAMYPLTSVTGFQVKAEGGGEWLALGYLGRIDEGTSADAANILQALKQDFRIDE